MNEEQVKEMLAEYKLSWEDFQSWMVSQTVSVDKNGNTIYWTNDVRRFISYKFGGKIIFD